MGEVIQGPWKKTPAQALDQELRRIAQAILEENDTVIAPANWPPQQALRSSPGGRDPQR